MRNPIGWFEIYVDDMARARTFYEAVFRIAFQPLESPGGPQMQAFPSSMEHYGAGGALVHMEGFKAGGNSTLVYFSCEDCAVEESRVVAAGGKVQKPKMSIGQYGHISLVVDTEGNMLGLHSM
jgi:predicted enzyme related to lactoylglutathione lyase